MAGRRKNILEGLRLLPVLIVAAVLLLTVRIGELTTGVDVGVTTVAIAETEEPAAKDEAHASEGDSQAGDSADGDEAGSSADDFEVVTQFTEEELEVLQGLVRRRDALEEREREIEQRGRLLDAAEARLETQIAELQSLRTNIESLVREYDDQEKAELESVVKIYETMKPKDAARILGDLEMKTLLGIMELMKERKTAPILAAMEPNRARQVTEEMARQRSIDLGAAPAPGG